MSTFEELAEEQGIDEEGCQRLLVEFKHPYYMNLWRYAMVVGWDKSCGVTYVRAWVKDGGAFPPSEEDTYSLGDDPMSAYSEEWRPVEEFPDREDMCAELLSP